MFKRIGILLLCLLPFVSFCPIASADQTVPTLTTYRQLPLYPPGEKTLRFVTLEWPPYISTEISGFGYVAEILRETFLIAGYSVELIFLPWQRALYYSSRPEIAGCLPEYFTPEIGRTPCLYSKPFPGGPITFMSRSSAPIRYTTIKALQQFKTGVVAGYINFKEFDEADTLQKDFSPDDITNIKKLLAYRVDIIIGDPLTAMYLYSKDINPQGREVSVQFPFIEEKQLYICFNPAFENRHTIVTLFNNQLAKLERSGRIDELHSDLMNRYLPILPVPERTSGPPRSE